jgi:protoporphyrinogen oxidase
MKRKIQLTKGLAINKEAIAKLQESQMAQLKGGMQELAKTCAAGSCINSCSSGSCNTKTVEEIS